MIILLLIFQGCHQQTNHEALSPVFATVIPKQQMDDLGVQFRVIKNSIPLICHSAWSLNSEETSQVVAQFHLDYSASMEFLRSQSAASQGLADDARTRRLVSRFQKLLSVMRTHLDRGNTKIPKNLIVLLTACHCLRLAASRSDIRRFFILRTMNVFTSKRYIDAQKMLHDGMTYQDIQFFQSLRFFIACQDHGCPPITNLIIGILHDPNHSLRQSIPIVNSLIFGEIPTDPVIDFWNKNIIPKLQTSA